MVKVHLKGGKGAPLSPMLFNKLKTGFDLSVVVLPEEDEEVRKELFLLFRILLGERIDILSFPEWEEIPGEVFEDERARSERIKALYRIALGKKLVLFTTLTALSQKTVEKKELLETCVEIKRGREYGFDRLLEELSSLGYRREDLVVEKGTFAVRGGIVDFFPPDRNLPIRVEFFGDEVVDLRSFDPSTQRSKGRLDSVRIITFKELDSNAPAEGSPLEHIKGRNAIFFLVDPLFSLSRAELFVERARKKGISDKVLDPGDVLEEIKDGFNVFIIGADPPFSVDGEEDVPVEGLPSGGALIKFLKEKSAEGFKIYAVSPEESFCRKMLVFLRRKGVFGKGIVGELSTGFSMEDERVVFVSFKDIFGHRIRKRQRPKLYNIIDYRSLKEGDLVAHYDHGIGIYRGIVNLEVDGIKTDFVLLEYAEGDKLYVPIYHLDKIQPYGGEEARIDRLGSKRWEILKRRTKETLKKILRELVDLYATREVVKGFSFSIPEEEYYEFVKRFPYEETPDQERAIEEVLEDMASERPMDRLICGDVGFGKTEVAMRAAFVAAMCGKQVAVLVPTTILAEQHYLNFKERFKDFPIVVEMLSRFRTKAEQKRVIEGLKEGKVDIVIGTHRLLQSDVSFKNLGLLIIDEEQRFGVKAKERLRELRKNVDTLTLSATPIPRTLQHALSGIKKLSVILTPPPNRKSVKTIIARFDEDLIKEAIEREVERGGQVYFIHNDIDSIYGMEKLLRRLVPDVSIAVAHGKMKERELEKVMLDFFKGDVDVLLCTTIVENGLDVPNANTLIVNHAERFGLAQLYQLRGRVGRSNVKSYAYLLLPREGDVPKEAIKRLKTLKEYEDLGSGYYIAMKDLEMRGCGNLLGKAQWGRVGEMGVETYMKILEEAVSEIKGVAEIKVDTEVDLGVPAYIPESYMESPRDKLEVYKRLSSMVHEDEVEDLLRELRDRFGPPPKEVVALLELVKIKILGKRMGLEKVRRKDSNLFLVFSPKALVDVERLFSFISKNKSWSFKDQNSLVFEMGGKLSINDIYGEIKRLFEAINPRFEEMVGSA